MNDSKNISVVMEKLEFSENEFRDMQNAFKLMVENEMSTSCFEQNAINSLINILALKAEIKQLKILLRILES